MPGASCSYQESTGKVTAKSKTVGGQVSSRRRHWSYHYDRHCYQRPGMQTIAYKMQKRHKLDEKTKAKRLARARLITGFYISWEQKQLRFGLLPPSVVWPDEKCLQLRQNSINRTTGFTACARHPRRLEICRETTIPCKYHGLGMTQTHWTLKKCLPR